MKVVILSFTQAGTRLGERIGSQFRNEGVTCQNYAPAGYAFADILPFPDNPKELIREGWGETSFLFIGAVGIAVRYIAPYVKDKFTDSAVVVMDEKAGYVIPLLSGHLPSVPPLARRRTPHGPGRCGSAPEMSAPAPSPVRCACPPSGRFPSDTPPP